MAKSNCQCELCKHSHAIEIPPDLVKDLLAGRVTVFAGAGISTESRTVLKRTFYEEILLDVGPIGLNSSFPDLMTLYCEKPNGRINLLEKIASRFRTIAAFPEMNGVASRFHRELGTFFPVKNIVTTNWDTYFEDVCKATPFVTHADLAFWEGARRRVLKIHGSISNYGSIVATAQDYAKCKRSLSTGMIGSLLKSILATQTVLFVGYSMTDSDFNYIYNFVKKQMQGMHRQAYVVTPFEREAEKFQGLGLKPLVTDGAYFFSLIKSHAIAQGIMLSDQIYLSACDLLDKVMDEHHALHKSFRASRNPEIIYAASYQDGLMHALQRAINLRGTGEYSDRGRLNNLLHNYVEIQREKRRREIYEDVAYIEGYINGLALLLCEDSAKCVSEVPLYFAFGINEEMFSIRDYKKHAAHIPSAHKKSFARAQRFVRERGVGDDIEFHHPAWL